MPSIRIPDPSLVLLVGAAGCGKSTFARRNFDPHEVVSSDECRALVSGDAADQAVTKDAFDILHLIVSRRLKHRRLAVVDATNVEGHARRSLLAIAHARRAPAVAIVFDLDEAVCVARSVARHERVVEENVIREQISRLRGSFADLLHEGYREVFVLSSPEEADSIVVERSRE